jgi:hypothetical protein
MSETMKKSVPVERHAITPVLCAIRKKVWHRDKGRCTHVERGSGKRCESRRELRIEWLYGFEPMSLESRNLRLRCKEHSAVSQPDPKPVWPVANAELETESGAGDQAG